MINYSCCYNQTGVCVMLVQPVNSVSFGQKSISKKTFNQLGDILTKMNKQAVYVENGTNYKSSFLKELWYKDFILKDGRGLIYTVAKEKQLQKETLIDTCYTQVVIDNKTGKIVNSSKPFIIPWNKLLKNIEENIEFISKNFENKNLVKRIRLESDGFTPNGAQKQKRLNDEFRKLLSEKQK